MAEPTPSRTPKALESLNRLTPVQRIGLGAAALTLVGGLFLFARSGSETAMAAIYTDLEGADAADVTEELTTRGVSYELTDGGRTVLVPRDDVYELRVALSGQGLPSNNEGYALLDQQGITTSEFRQRVDYQRALEGELARTLRSIDGVESAIVHLALPEDSVFVDEAENPTASVLVRTGGLSSLSSEQVDGMVHLVASSVKGMSPADVTIADASGAVLANNGSTSVSSGGSSGGGRTDATTAVEAEIANEIRAMLSRVTGAGNVTVSVQAELDLTERVATTEKFDTSGEDGQLVIAERTGAEQYEGASSNDGETGVLGPDGAPVDEAGGDTSTNYTRDDAERTYAVDRTVEQIRNSPGAITRLSVAVLVDESSVSPEQLATIEQVVATAAGIDADRGDQVTVSALPFDTSAIEESEAAAEEAATAVAAQEQASMIRTAVIAFVMLLGMLLAYRSTRRARREIATPIDIGAIQASSDTDDDEAPMAIEEPVVPPMPELDPVTVASRDALDELSVLADRKPDEVAQILQNWLVDEGSKR